MEPHLRVLTANRRLQRPEAAPRLKLLLELEPRHRVFFRNLTDLLLSRSVPQIAIGSRHVPFWDDVFVPSGILWASFLQSMLWHLLLMVLLVWGHSKLWVPEGRFSVRDALPASIHTYPHNISSFPVLGARTSGVRARSLVKHTSASPSAIAVRPQQKPRMVPLSALPGPRWNESARPFSVGAQPPKVDQATARWVPLPQASAVAPAPDLAGASPAGAMKAPGMGGLRAVPPSPSAQDIGNTPKAESYNPLSNAGAGVVPPSPSLEDTSSASTGAGPLFMAPAGSPVIPPPPSIQSQGNRGLARPAELPSDSQVTPPPPPIENSGGERRFSSGNDANSDIVAAAPSIDAAGNSVAGGPATATDSRSVVAASSPLPVHRENKPTIEELPLHFIGLILAVPGTSFFSNFEVFVAKRRVAKDQLQLIKLVYEFLPYQRRLSEYNLNDLSPRIIKLRITSDPSCDESLGQITHTPADPTRPATEYSKTREVLLSSDPNAVLPCYRTTADDFEKAMLRAQ